MDLTTAAPAEIDAKLLELLVARSRAAQTAERYRELAMKADFDYYRDSYDAEADKYDAEAARLDVEAAPLDAEYGRRGGWTRSWVVPGGHVHRSTSCFTLTPRTQVGWLTECSGMDADEVIELAGERACTFCYPDAPVAVLARPSRLREDVEAREAAEAKAKADADRKAAKNAKAIANPDGTPLRGRWGVIRTVVTAWNEAVSDLADVELYGYTFGAEEAKANTAIVAALAAKLGQTEDEIRATMDKKVAAKVKRDRR